MYNQKAFKRAGFRAVSSGFAVFLSVALLSVTLLSVTLLSVMFLASCEDIMNEDDEPAVHGSVLSALSGSPLAGAPVTLKRGGATIASAETSVDGAYSFTGIEAGEGYTVEASASIYAESETDEFSVSGNKSGVNILLNRDWPEEGEPVGSVVIPPEAITGTGNSPTWNPSKIAFGPDGTLYITQPEQRKILQAAPGASTVTDFAGTGEHGYLDHQSALLAMFKYPLGLVSAPNGDIYVTDSQAHRVRKISDGQVTTIAGTGDDGGFSGDNGLAINAKLNGPNGIAMDDSGNIYIADRGNQRIRKIDPSGIITTIAGTGTPGSTGDNGLAVNATLNYPIGVAVDADGNIYIAEQMGYCVRKIDAATHNITTVAGSVELGGGNLAELSVAADGTLYIVIMNPNRILTLSGGPVSVLIQLGYRPNSIAFGPDGYLYVCDNYNRQIVRY